MEDQSSFDNFELQLNSDSKEFLRETAKWAYFLSILGFVFVGLFVLVGVFMGTLFASVAGSSGAFVPTTAMSIMYIVLAAIYFFPVLYLYRFASKIKRAFNENNTEYLTEGLKNLKSHYKFVGILAIVMISFYLLAIAISRFSGLANLI